MSSTGPGFPILSIESAKLQSQRIDILSREDVQWHILTAYINAIRGRVKCQKRGLRNSFRMAAAKRFAYLAISVSKETK